MCLRLVSLISSTVEKREHCTNRFECVARKSLKMEIMASEFLLPTYTVMTWTNKKCHKIFPWLHVIFKFYLEFWMCRKQSSDTRTNKRKNEKIVGWKRICGTNVYVVDLKRKTPNEQTDAQALPIWPLLTLALVSLSLSLWVISSAATAATSTLRMNYS